MIKTNICLTFIHEKGNMRWETKNFLQQQIEDLLRPILDEYHIHRAAVTAKDLYDGCRNVSLTI